MALLAALETWYWTFRGKISVEGASRRKLRNYWPQTRVLKDVYHVAAVQAEDFLSLYTFFCVSVSFVNTRARLQNHRSQGQTANKKSGKNLENSSVNWKNFSSCENNCTVHDRELLQTAGKYLNWPCDVKKHSQALFGCFIQDCFKKDVLHKYMNYWILSYLIIQ